MNALFNTGKKLTTTTDDIKTTIKRVCDFPESCNTFTSGLSHSI
jgi:hypothetical protein